MDVVLTDGLLEDVRVPDAVEERLTENVCEAVVEAVAVLDSRVVVDGVPDAVLLREELVDLVVVRVFTEDSLALVDPDTLCDERLEGVTVPLPDEVAVED